MRALILTSSPADLSAIPQLADEQIIAGPDWPDAQDTEGRWLSLRAPGGYDDLNSVLAKIPEDQRPNIVVWLPDVSQATVTANAA
jgi:hypothetical protein